MAADGTARCTNSEPGWLNHECGKTASWVGTNAAGRQACFCNLCAKTGAEARGITDWKPINAGAA